MKATPKLWWYYPNRIRLGPCYGDKVQKVFHIRLWKVGLTVSRYKRSTAYGLRGYSRNKMAFDWGAFSLVIGLMAPQWRRDHDHSCEAAGCTKEYDWVEGSGD